MKKRNVVDIPSPKVRPEKGGSKDEQDEEEEGEEDEEQETKRRRRRKRGGCIPCPSNCKKKVEGFHKDLSLSYKFY